MAKSERGTRKKTSVLDRARPTQTSDDVENDLDTLLRLCSTIYQAEVGHVVRENNPAFLPPFRMFAYVVLTLSVFAFLADSLVLNSPRETLSTPADAILTGWTPRPTSPAPGELVRRRLEKRDLSTNCAYVIL
jgi:hypothetical protein